MTVNGEWLDEDVMHWKQWLLRWLRYVWQPTPKLLGITLNFCWCLHFVLCDELLIYKIVILNHWWSDESSVEGFIIALVVQIQITNMIFSIIVLITLPLCWFLRCCLRFYEKLFYCNFYGLNEISEES